MSKETELKPMERNNSKLFLKKRKTCPISAQGVEKIDYKNPNALRPYISEGGRMLPSRITNVSAKNQRKLKKAIRLARILALLPFVYKVK